MIVSLMNVLLTALMDPSGQLGGRKLYEQISRPTDQCLVRQVFWDSRQKMMHHGHITFTFQHLLLAMENNLRRSVSF